MKSPIWAQKQMQECHYLTIPFCQLSVKVQFCFICGCLNEGTMYSGMYSCVGRVVDCTLKMKAAYSSKIFVSINTMSLPQRPQNNYSPPPNPQVSYRFISWPLHFRYVYICCCYESPSEQYLWLFISCTIELI